jgi:hypothetical protein
MAVAGRAKSARNDVDLVRWMLSMVLITLMVFGDWFGDKTDSLAAARR